VQKGRRLDHNSGVVCSDETKEGYIPELFTCEQKANGAIVFYILGVLYMFVGLSIVCDEFFVPALEGFVEAFNISDDVAGATFMAAGGSAPELFTSFMGVFVAKSSVGFGTIVGSAVFNVLFVIGMCAMFSKEILVLTWWPLFRDCSYYAMSLGVLAYFFGGGEVPGRIEWWESLLLLVLYAGYVLLMKYNENLHQVIERWLAKGKTTPEDSAKGDAEEQKIQEPTEDHPFRRRTQHKRKSGVNVLARPTKFRAGILQHVFKSDSENVIKRARTFVVKELIGDVHETFAQIDRNGDEKIDRGELTLLLKELTGSEPLKEDIDGALADMQLDDTGEVTKEEFIKWYQ
jgi:K+-dependent Na+/Ca+ exchanger-like protein